MINLLKNSSAQEVKSWQRKREEVFLQLCKAEGEGSGQHKRFFPPSPPALGPCWHLLVLVGWLWTLPDLLGNHQIVLRTWQNQGKTGRGCVPVLLLRVATSLCEMWLGLKS